MPKIKTAVSLDPDVQEATDLLADQLRLSRSALVNRVLLEQLILKPRGKHTIDKESEVIGDAETQKGEKSQRTCAAT